MNIKPEKYERINNVQLKAGNDLIDLIIKDHSERLFDVILDIGCGSGNLTELLSIRVKHNQLIGLDTNSTSIHFANGNHETDTIVYIIEDISKPWDELNSNLRELEGKVSLIFSNYVIHWIENKEIVAKNLEKLLSKDGYVYINACLVPDINKILNKEQRIENEKFIKVPAFEVQIKIWQNLFTKYGISILSTDLFEENWNLYKQQVIETLKPISGVYNPYILSKDLEEKEMIRKKFEDLIFDAMVNGNEGTYNPNAYKEFKDNQTIVIKSIRMQFYRFVCIKI